jgi:predicted site-specific integrase-resolvase
MARATRAVDFRIMMKVVVVRRDGIETVIVEKEMEELVMDCLEMVVGWCGRYDIDLVD